MPTLKDINWKELIPAFSDVWMTASWETRRGLLTVAACVAIICSVGVMGVAKGLRGAPSVEGGEITVIRDGKTIRVVVKGRIALLQKRLRGSHWNVALVWGESEANWLKKRRFYLANETMVAAVEGQRRDEFTGEVEAGDLVVGEMLSHLEVGDRVTMTVKELVRMNCWMVSEVQLR